MKESLHSFYVKYKLPVVGKGWSHRKKDTLWDRLTALLQTVNEIIVILLLTVRPKFCLPSAMNGNRYRASYCSYSFRGLAPYGQWTFAVLIALCSRPESRSQPVVWFRGPVCVHLFPSDSWYKLELALKLGVFCETKC